MDKREQNIEIKSSYDLTRNGWSYELWNTDTHLAEIFIPDSKENHTFTVFKPFEISLSVMQKYISIIQK